MSERDKDNNARRKGRLAYHEGKKLEDNPMRAMDSRYVWRCAYLEEKEICEAYDKLIAARVAALEGNT